MNCRESQSKIMAGDFTSRRQLERLHEALLCAQEEERRRIAADLHDGVGQSLSAVNLGVARLRQMLGGRLTDMEEEIVACINRHIAQATEEVRRVCMNLRPPMLDDLGVVSAVNWFCSELREVLTTVDIVQRVRATEHEIPAPVKVAIFRILQEASSNACKHSQAKHLWVTLDADAEAIQLEIADDGIGFMPVPAQPNRRGFGLTTMRERASMTRGSLSIRSQPGQGTCISARWPAQASGEVAALSVSRTESNETSSRLSSSTHGVPRPSVTPG